ncbi:unnamed protein product [Phytophthora lilii]|uniref:Unnamed protein product n=1 Tax=Phytophthora lilii TaxID=2077276 RepID=A0A9W6UCM9_9STRA|nr:unnamed protein product [Phytophthora lilii]
MRPTTSNESQPSLRVLGIKGSWERPAEVPRGPRSKGSSTGQRPRVAWSAAKEHFKMMPPSRTWITSSPERPPGPGPGKGTAWDIGGSMYRLECYAAPSQSKCLLEHDGAGESLTACVT